MTFDNIKNFCNKTDQEENLISFLDFLHYSIKDQKVKKINIPRKSLNYQTPIECFMNHVGKKYDKSMWSRLI